MLIYEYADKIHSHIRDIRIRFVDSHYIVSFFDKLKLNIPAEEAETSTEQIKRKRGRPRKYPPQETAFPEVEMEKRGRGRPRKFQENLQGQPRKEEAQKKDVEEEPKKADEGELTIDVYETDGELVIQSPVAGVSSEDIEVTIEDDMLIIRGERPAPSPEEREKTIMQECYWGPFSRRFVLPVEVDGRVKASLEKGILTIRMPKADRSRKRKIAVEELEE